MDPLVVSVAVFLALVIGVLVWALCRQRPEPATLDLTAQAFVRWLDCGRPDLRLFLSWSEAEQIGLAELARRHRDAGHRALAAVLRDVGTEAVDHELAALQQMASETTGEAPPPAQAMTMAGAARRETVAAAPSGPGPQLFGRRPRAKEPT